MQNHLKDDFFRSTVKKSLSGRHVIKIPFYNKPLLFYTVTDRFKGANVTCAICMSFAMAFLSFTEYKASNRNNMVTFEEEI